MPSFSAPFLQTLDGPAFEIYPYVLFRGDASQRKLQFHDLSFESAVFLEPRFDSDALHRFDFEIDDDSIDEILTILASNLGFDATSSLGYAPGEADGVHLAALLACATQRGSRNTFGLPIFEDSRQLAVDLEAAQNPHLPEEAKVAEFQAAFIYRSLFTENSGHYRTLRSKDFENWGISCWALEILKFIERSIDMAYGNGEPARRPPLQDIERLVAANWPNFDSLEHQLKSELDLFKQISTNPSARLIELCSMFQYIRENNHNRTPYYEYLRTIAAPAMKLQNDEDERFFYANGFGVMASRKPIASNGEWSTTGLWSILSKYLTIDFEVVDDVWDLLEDCINPFALLEAEKTQGNDAQDYFSLVLAHAPTAINADFDYKAATNNWAKSLEGREANTSGIFFAEPKLPSPYQAQDIAINSNLISKFTSQSFENYERILDLLLDGAANREMGWVVEQIQIHQDHEVFGSLLLLEHRREVIKAQNSNSQAEGEPILEPKGTWEVEKALVWWLNQRYEAQIAEKSESEDFKKMRTTLEEKGLKLPFLPPRLSTHMRTIGNWQWGTEYEHDFFKDYSFWDAIHEVDQATRPEHAFIGQSGHGLNSYALTLNIRLEGTAIICQTGFGGVYGENSREVESWNEMVSTLEPLLKQLSDSNSDEDQELDQILYFSDLRSEATIATAMSDGTFEKVEFKSLKDAVAELVGDKSNEWY